jgi:uncharacterized spore protein YtfJ
MDEIRGILEAMGGKLGDLANGEAVVGSPIQLGAVTVYPISRVSMFLAAGGGEGENIEMRTKMKGLNGEQPDSGKGGGAGGGARARPVAVLVMSEDGVSLLPIPDAKGKLDRLLEKIPELIERIKPTREGSCC